MGMALTSVFAPMIHGKIMCSLELKSKFWRSVEKQNRSQRPHILI